MQTEKLIVTETDIASRCRATHKPGVYGLLPAANRVFSQLPYFNGVQAQVLATPQLGARFVQHELTINAGGSTTKPVEEDLEQFFYLLEGDLQLNLNGKTHPMVAGSFFWLPPHQPYAFANASEGDARALWIRRRYVEIEGVKIPAPIIAHESDVAAEPVDTYMEQHLTPYEQLGFDMGINIQVFEPGVYFSFVESHIMEHGLYMLEGRGIYWLNQDFMEVQKDDFIYMAPFCSQFFYATGWDKSAYLLYKDVNRDYVEGL